MKKLICILLIVLTVFACVACNNTTYAEVRVGSSKVILLIPEDYQNVKENFGEDQVAHYFLNDESVSIDAYQWLKVANFPVEKEASSYAQEYGAELYQVTVGELKLMRFTSHQTKGSIKYTVENYFVDDGAHIVMLCFWTRNTDDHKKFVEETIKSISIEA